MTINEIKDRVFENAEKHGFHENNDFGRSLMLVVSELSEALEADRNGKWVNEKYKNLISENMSNGQFIDIVKGTVEEEIADAIIRLCDIAGVWGIDLNSYIKAKMAYNETRPYKHGKRY